MEITFTNEGILAIAIIFGIFIFVYLIVREIRLMKTNSRKIELELEREKLSILRQDGKFSGHSVVRLNDDQIGSLRDIDELNSTLEQGIFVKQKLVEGRIRKLEGMIKTEKLDRMLDKIHEEEKKIA